YPKDKGLLLKRKRDTERLQTLMDFVDGKGPVPADEGEREAIRFMRREAEISLVQAGAPAVAALRTGAPLEVPVGYDLLRVLVKGKGAFDPAPALGERVEAALGICHLKNPDAAGYDPSVGVYAVGLCFLDYATEYAKDFVNIVGRKDLKNIKESKI